MESQSSSDATPDDGYISSNIAFGAKCRKKYADDELEKLETAFHVNWYPSRDYRQHLAFELGVPSKNIQVWFQNRRAREKNQIQKAAGMVEDPIERMRFQLTNSSRLPFRPITNNVVQPAFPAWNSPSLQQPREIDTSRENAQQTLTENEECFAPNGDFADFARPDVFDGRKHSFRSPLHSTSNVSDISDSCLSEILKSLDGNEFPDWSNPFSI